MSFTREYQVHGFESFRDRTFRSRGISIAERLVEYSHEILEVDLDTNLKDRGNGRPECTTADVLGQVFIPSATPGTEDPEGRPIGSLWHGAPVRVVSSTPGPPPGESGVPASIEVLPIFDSSYGEDERYAPLAVSPFPGDPVPEVDAIGIVFSATKEDGDPEYVFMGPTSNRLLAPNLRGADFTRGTYVYDLEGEEGDEPSEEYKAQLQTAWRVMRPIFGKEGTTETIFGVPSEERGLSNRIAIQLGFAQDGESAPCMGLMVDQDSFAGSTIGGVTPLVAGFFGIKAGGPLFAGESTAEKHKLEPAGTGSETRDGETQCAGHVGTCTFFKTPGGGKFFDAPLAFRPETFPRVPDMPFPMQTKLLYRLDAKHLFRGREEDHVWDWVSFYDFGGSHDDPTGSDGGTGDGTGGAGSGSEDPPPGGGVEDPVDPPDKPTEPRIPPDPPEVFCAGPEGLKKKEKITPTLARFRGNEDPHLMHKSYRYTPYHMAYTGILAKGNPSIIGEYGKDFTDYTRQASIKDIDLYRDTAPISGQLISYAGHAENPFIAKYNQYPESVDGKYLAGTASGGFILMQPELDLAGFREVIDGIISVSDLYSATLSQTRLTFAPEARISFGVPGLDDGLLFSDTKTYGWDFYIDSASTMKVIQHASGSSSTVVSFPDTSNDYFVFSKDIHGLFATPVRTVTSTTTLLVSDYKVLVDASSGPVTITLPSASTMHSGGYGKELIVKRIDNSVHSVKVSRSGSDLIDGATTNTDVNTQWVSRTFSSDGSNWYIT